MIIVDGHEDIAFNSINFGRNYLQSALAIRKQEADSGSENPGRNGQAMLGLSEWLLGRVAVTFATIFTAPKRRTSGWELEVYSDIAEAYKGYGRELDYYHRLVDEHPQFGLIGSRGDLEEILATWAGDKEVDERRIGLVPLMEGADCIRTPSEAEEWMERGIRMIGLSWAGTRYAGGTGDPGPLTSDGRALLDVMAGLGLMLDLSHASEQSFYEELDHFPGTVLASHANPRAICVPRVADRNLTDDQIRVLAERGGVMGIVPYNGFLRNGWRPADGKQAVTLQDVAAAIDHVCQVTGSVDHVAIGSDFDGGFGAESTPAGIDTVADLLALEPVLAERGYGPAEIEKVLGGNWLAVLRRGLPA